MRGSDAAMTRKLYLEDLAVGQSFKGGPLTRDVGKLKRERPALETLPDG